MYTSQVRQLTGATDPRFQNRWEWSTCTECGHQVDGGIAETEHDARAAAEGSLASYHLQESFAYWLDRFNAYTDGRALGMSAGLFWEVGKYGISIDQLDAMIEAAKACRYTAELQPEIESWKRLLDAQLSRLDSQPLPMSAQQTHLEPRFIEPGDNEDMPLPVPPTATRKHLSKHSAMGSWVIPDPMPSGSATGRVVDESRSVARINYDAGMKLLPELHQARWAERYGELMRDRSKAKATGDVTKVEELRQAILEHHKSRYDTSSTRELIEAQYRKDLEKEEQKTAV
ncbi:hypothetical protein [Rhodanobacter sp. DHB23]|uniref:hypothetical protein n=1 Tax=Rhodanobacter sp. DHB23 TaxID=2775923 RepID=UPI0017860029|nr:hypothetical protein [Rhodanobacter sp. DHB23]MBD8872876.1 hypothetical protein [Rhodanobacter sp. DHB23]